jgi:hypothetical protein
MPSDLAQQFKPPRCERGLHRFQIEEGRLRLVNRLAALEAMPHIDATPPHVLDSTDAHLHHARHGLCAAAVPIEVREQLHHSGEFATPLLTVKVLVFSLVGLVS